MSTSLPPAGRRRPATGLPPPPAEPRQPSRPLSGRARLVTLGVLGCLALVSGAGLAAGLVSCAPPGHTDPARALTAAEADRLAAMRITNYRAGRVGVYATLGIPGTQIELAGAVDWPRGLAYLSVAGPGAGSQRGLLQAVPGLVLSRPDPPAGTGPTGGGPGPLQTLVPPSPAPPPPAQPPGDGWRVRRMVTSGPVPAAVDSFLTLLFAVAADRSDPTGPLLGRDTARWLGRDRAGGTTVDVLLGPAVPALTGNPTSGTDGTIPAPPTGGLGGGAVRYWLDRDGRLHRFEALLAGDVPVQVDFDRAERPELTAVAALGGAPVRPRAATRAETDLLTRVRAENRALGGAGITLAVPTTQPLAELPAVNLRGAGWVDWSDGVAYLALDELDRPGERTLLRANRTGVAVRDVPSERDVPASGGAEPPPLPPPRDRDWDHLSWQRRTDALGAPDLDLLVNEALAVGGAGLGPADRLRDSASWLRQDELDGRPVTVFEVPKEAEAQVGRGQARMRYWVDRSGLLRRLELRTRTGAFAQLDLTPGPVPDLPTVPLG
ncbi:hypothetical protein AB0J90_19735 [Micromonospora sp. NPDC049523]|uniref:hypothetical protein n=1 Tax=Micromonospora sp. NPDC049523 TaxID=3155921 RepID=UPI003414533F